MLFLTNLALRLPYALKMEVLVTVIILKMVLLLTQEVLRYLKITLAQMEAEAGAVLSLY